MIVRGARAWFDADPAHFDYDGGLLIASVFPELANGLQPLLSSLIDGGDEQDLAFVLGVLSGFKGQPFIYDLVRSIVARLREEARYCARHGQCYAKAMSCAVSSGMQSCMPSAGSLLATWLEDESETVRSFAAELIGDLDRSIAAENRSAESSIALRKLDYGEDLGNGEAE